MMRAPETAPPMRARILVIDDEPDICETLDVVLSLAGYEVVTAKSGDDGIARAEQQPFQLVITDLLMPGTSGVDTLAAMKRIDPRTAVIVVSGYASEEEALRCRTEGAARILDKPFQLDDLLQVVQAALRDGGRGP